MRDKLARAALVHWFRWCWRCFRFEFGALQDARVAVRILLGGQHVDGELLQGGRTFGTPEQAHARLDEIFLAGALVDVQFAVLLDALAVGRQMTMG